jgi:HK97 family phage major capsid protein
MPPINLKSYYDAATNADAEVQRLAVQINSLFESDQTKEALALKPKLETAKATAKEANELYILMKETSAGPSNLGDDPSKRFVPAGGDQEPKEAKDIRASSEYSKQFWNAVMMGATPKSVKMGQHSIEKFGLLMNLSETGGTPAGEEGGFLLPVDFDGKIKELQRSLVDLSKIFNSESVTAYSGWRAVQQAAAALPFAAFTEMGAGGGVAATEEPKWNQVLYTLVAYGGRIPVANDLLTDTPVNLMAYLAKWAGQKEIITKNSRILSLVNAISPSEAVTDLENLFPAIKTALNKTLDPAISALAKIIVNQSGFNLLDQLVDGTGRPLLQPDPTQPTKRLFQGREVVVLSNAAQPDISGNTVTRIAIGDGMSFATLFGRAAMEFASTNIGGNAWAYNISEVRAITRLDEAVMDADAMTLITSVVSES